jgi:hypothetical protein
VIPIGVLSVWNWLLSGLSAGLPLLTQDLCANEERDISLSSVVHL